MMNHFFQEKNRVSIVLASKGSPFQSDSCLTPTKKGCCSKRSTSAHEIIQESKLLPESFQLTPFTVVIGKSKESRDAEGNKQLKALAQCFLAKYANAETKGEKSEAVSLLVELVQARSPEGAFVKRGDDGRWYEVCDSVAREKVGYVFRELLHVKYKSSSASKAAKRLQEKILCTNFSDKRRMSQRPSFAMYESMPTVRTQLMCEGLQIILKAQDHHEEDVSPRRVSDCTSSQSSIGAEETNVSHSCTSIGGIPAAGPEVGDTDPIPLQPHGQEEVRRSFEIAMSDFATIWDMEGIHVDEDEWDARCDSILSGLDNNEH